MNELWIPFLSALFGAIIGSLASVLIVIVQTRSERRRDRTRLAVQAAIEDYKRAVEMAKDSQREQIFQPLSSYIHYHSRVLDLLEKGSFSAEDFREINKQQNILGKIAQDIYDDAN